MSANEGESPTSLDEIIEEFADLDSRERLELLLDFAENLPPLPERFREERKQGKNRIQECQTPVYLWVEVEQGRVQIYGDVAPEAPTVKGFVAILVEAFSGRTPEEVLAVPQNVLSRMGLIEALGMLRSRGLSGVLKRIREEIEKRQPA
jgi:cysteine desulfuration protein SufE